MEQFETYFRRADLDQDGRISGAEAVAFLQGSGLSNQVLAQIWVHANKSQTGFLNREEFYNALKLVTVAQSKRGLTPDIVKSALYGPASTKIPAPQIKLAGNPIPQLNSAGAAPVPQSIVASVAPSSQMGATAPVVSQSFRGQAPPGASVNPQYFASQGNQSMRPPLPMPAGAGSVMRPQQGVATNISRGGTAVGPGLQSSNMSTEWLSGRTSGAFFSALMQAPTGGTSFPMPQVASTPQDSLSTTSITTSMDPNALIGSGNKPSYLASSVPSSTSVPVSTAPQSAAKPDPFVELQSTFNRQPQQTQSVPKQVAAQATASFPPSGTPTAAGTSGSEHSQIPWPKMTQAMVQKYGKVFMEVDTDRDGRITGEEARNLFLSWRLPRETLKQVWDLSDQDSDSMLTLREFCVALYLMEQYRGGRQLPSSLPPSVMLDETLLSMAGPPAAAYGAAGWGPPGLRPQQGIPGSQQTLTPSGIRPPMQTMHLQADGSMKFDQKGARGFESSPENQLSNGEPRSMGVRGQDAAETENKAESNDKVYLDSKEKLEFYRSKMQDLVLYKSRCDNRLNEITERALADKREAEMLGKKYEEKYKQVADIASKMTIEEASFREVQERKMELQQAITKMEQGGSADGILQVRADRIQSDLEELLKALAERCKKHGIELKSTALVELPAGWQPGIPEVVSVWDEDWDKFEDEGFSFDVAMPANGKPSSPEKGSSPAHSYSSDSVSNADVKSENISNKGGSAFEAESAYFHSEDESKSPQPSPRRQEIFDSPSKDYSDNHFGNSFEPDAETHRSFDEPSWGTFDNNDDIDSVWGFNVKDPDREKHGEAYFFDSNNSVASPRTDSPRTDSFFKKSSPFTFEESTPGSPVSRAAHSPTKDSFFDSFSRYDSFNTNDHASSPRRDTFTRFDSMTSTQGFDHSRGYSFDDSDPFGSSGPFKVSSETRQSLKKDSEHWNSF